MRDVESHGGERKRAWRDMRWVYVLGCEYVTIVIQQQNEIRCDKSETEEKRKIGRWGTSVTVSPILCTCANNPASRTQ